MPVSELRVDSPMTFGVGGFAVAKPGNCTQYRGRGQVAGVVAIDDDARARAPLAEKGAGGSARLIRFRNPPSASART